MKWGKSLIIGSTAVALALACDSKDDSDAGAAGDGDGDVIGDGDAVGDGDGDAMGDGDGDIPGDGDGDGDDSGMGGADAMGGRSGAGGAREPDDEDEPLPSHERVWDFRELTGVTRSEISLPGASVDSGTWNTGSRVAIPISVEGEETDLLVWENGTFSSFDVGGWDWGAGTLIGTSAGIFHRAPSAQGYYEIFPLPWPQENDVPQISELTIFPRYGGMVSLGDDGMAALGYVSMTSQVGVLAATISDETPSFANESFSASEGSSRIARRDTNSAWAILPPSENMESWSLSIIDRSAESLVSTELQIDCELAPMFLQGHDDAAAVYCADSGEIRFPDDGGFGPPQGFDVPVIQAAALLRPDRLFAVVGATGERSFALLDSDGGVTDLPVGDWAASIHVYSAVVLPRDEDSGEVLFAANADGEVLLMMLHFDLQRGGILGAPRVIDRIDSGWRALGRLDDGRAHVFYRVTTGQDEEVDLFRLAVIDPDADTELELWTE